MKAAIVGLCVVSVIFCACAHTGIEAAKRGDLAGIKDWLQNGGLIDSVGGANQGSALHAAVSAGQVEAAKLLLQNRANPDLLDENQNTPLCVALRSKQSGEHEVELVELLLAAGADPNKKCSAETPLHWAALHYKWDAALRLLQRSGVSQRPYSKAEEPLCKAALSARADVVKLLLQTGTDPNVHDTAAIFDALNTPQKDSYEVVRLLVQAGANLKVQQKGDGTGDTALHRVVLLRTYGSERLVDIMVNHGASPYAVNHNRELPLDTALDKSQRIAMRMIKHMALELPSSNSLKVAYDKMVMSGIQDQNLQTIERMMALAGYLEVQARLLNELKYAKRIQDAHKRAAAQAADQKEAKLYTGMVTYAKALVGALANAAEKGNLDRDQIKDAFTNLMSTVYNDTAETESARTHRGVVSSEATHKVLSVVSWLRQIEA